MEVIPVRLLKCQDNLPTVELRKFEEFRGGSVERFSARSKRNAINTNLCNIVLLVILVMRFLSIFESWLILIGVG